MSIKNLTHEEKLERFDGVIGGAAIVMMLSFIIAAWVWATLGITWKGWVALAITEFFWYTIFIYAVGIAKKDYIKKFG